MGWINTRQSQAARQAAKAAASLANRRFRVEDLRETAYCPLCLGPCFLYRQLDAQGTVTEVAVVACSVTHAEKVVRAVAAEEAQIAA